MLYTIHLEKGLYKLRIILCYDVKKIKDDITELAGDLPVLSPMLI